MRMFHLILAALPYVAMGPLLAGCDRVNQAIDGTRCVALERTDFKLCLPQRYFEPRRGVLDEQEVHGMTLMIPRSEAGLDDGTNMSTVRVMLTTTPERLDDIRENLIRQQLGVVRSDHSENGMAVLFPNPESDPRTGNDLLLPEDGTPVLFQCQRYTADPGCTAWRLWYEDGRAMNVLLNYPVPRQEISRWSDDERKLRNWLAPYLVDTAQKSN